MILRIPRLGGLVICSKQMMTFTVSVEREGLPARLCHPGLTPILWKSSFAADNQTSQTKITGVANFSHFFTLSEANYNWQSLWNTLYHTFNFCLFCYQQGSAWTTSLPGVPPCLGKETFKVGGCDSTRRQGRNRKNVKLWPGLLSGGPLLVASPLLTTIGLLYGGDPDNDTRPAYIQRLANGMVKDQVRLEQV